MRRPMRRPMLSTTAAKTVFLDIETAPNQVWAWELWESDAIDTVHPWYMLSFAYKLSGGAVTTKSLPDYPSFKHDKRDDSALVRDLWSVLDAADIVVCHNGDRFDIPKSNARFVALGLNRPSPYRTVDTRKLARRYFKFSSNRLDYLGQYLGIGRKLPHTGFDLWKRCMDGDEAAWAEMLRYNRRDVVLLEKVYLKLRGWSETHPPSRPGVSQACRICGSKRLQSRGWTYTTMRRKRRFQCQMCGGWQLGAVEKLEQ